MRPTFDRRLWILLFWYFILKCIPPTDQQITSQKVSGQKIQELADTRESANIRILPECANCTSSSSSRSLSTSGASRPGDGDQERGENQRSTKSKQKAHQKHHRHQVNKFHDGQQVNNGELPGNHKANVQHGDDSLKKPPGAYRHGSQRHSPAPPQLPSPISEAAVDPNAPATNAPPGGEGEIRSRLDNRLRLLGRWRGAAKDAAGPAKFIDVNRESVSGYADSASQSHFLAGIFRKLSSTSVLEKTRKISSESSSGYFSYANADTDANAVSTELHENVIGNPDVESGFNGVEGEEIEVVVHRVKRSTSGSGSDLEPSDSERDREQLNSPVSSSDISKSDIRYNETLSPNLNPPSTSSSGGDAALTEQFAPQLPSPLPKTDVSNLSFSGSVDKHVISDAKVRSSEPIIIIDDGEEFDSGISSVGDSRSLEEYAHDEPRVLPLRPVIRGPSDNSEHGNEMSVVYAEQHTEIKLACEVDIDIATNVWLKNGQIVHAMDRTSRVADYRFIKEPLGGITITNVMLEDDGKWQCEAENSRGYVETARPVKLVVLDRPKPPYLLIDSRRLDAGNIFVPVKENSELSLACVSEGGNPKPTLTWEVLLSPGVDRHAQKVAAEVLELEEIKSEKEEPYKINSGAKSEARLPAVYRAHHNARILCVMEHPTLKMRQNASLLLDVQYTPSFAISRTPGFGYPLREGIEVSLKCDVDSNPPSTPRWQKDDGDTPVPQTGDGFLNFTSIRREHSGWYKCTSRHLNFQYSSIGYYLSVRYDSVDVTSEPDDQEVSVAASHNPNKGQLEVQLGGAVTLQCPQGSLGCWSHLDPVTARLRGLGVGISTPTGQFSLKDVVYQDAGTYKCIGQSPSNKKKLEVLQTVGVLVKGAPTAIARNATPVAYPGSPLHLTVEFCANPPAYAARWLHGDRVYTPGNQYGSTVLAYGVTDLPTPFCKEARLTYVSMHERVPRTFYFIVSSPGGVAETIFKVNFTLRYRTMSNSIDEEEEELSEPEEIHFPVFGNNSQPPLLQWTLFSLQLLLLYTINTFMYVLL